MSLGSLMLSRRAIIEAGLALTAVAAPAAASAADYIGSAVSDPAGYPGEAADRLLLPGFRRTTIETTGMLVNGTKTSGATIKTLVGGS